MSPNPHSLYFCGVDYHKQPKAVNLTAIKSIINNFFEVVKSFKICRKNCCQQDAMCHCLTSNE